MSIFFDLDTCWFHMFKMHFKFKLQSLIQTINVILIYKLYW